MPDSVYMFIFIVIFFLAVHIGPRNYPKTRMEELRRRFKRIR